VLQALSCELYSCAIEPIVIKKQLKLSLKLCDLLVHSSVQQAASAAKQVCAVLLVQVSHDCSQYAMPMQCHAQQHSGIGSSTGTTYSRTTALQTSLVAL
jgi:hypothetical protein